MRPIPDIRGAVRERSSLIHCITNPISINQCANAILAVGGRPIMAEHPREVSEITATAGALMLNLGNITDVRMEAMCLSARTAAEQGTPAEIGQQLVGAEPAGKAGRHDDAADREKGSIHI